MKNLIKTTKLFVMLAFAMVFAMSANAQNVGINTTGATPDPSAALDVVSTSQGILVPRMTSTQRLSISSPATGLLVFDNTIGNFMFYNGSFWQGINTDDQELSKKGDSILLESGKGVDISKYLQTLSLSGDTIKLTDGGYVVVKAGSSKLLVDDDTDTKIEVEKTSDDDIIRFSTQGTEYFSMQTGHLQVDNTGGSTFMGYYAGYNDDLTSNYNNFIGYYAGYSNTGGLYNVAMGYYPAYSNTTGDYLVAIGRYPLYNNTGNNNIAIGQYPMYTNTSGGNNTAAGYYALGGNTTGYSSVGIGYNAGRYSTTGSGQLAIGGAALFRASSGGYNTALGISSGYNSTTDTYTNSTHLGYGAPRTASNQVRIGNSSISSIGGYANWTNISDARFKNDVVENVPGLDFIMNLRPVTYTLDVKKINEFNGFDHREALIAGGVDPSTDFTALYAQDEIASKVLHTGFIAQEVEAAAQQLGYDFSGVDTPDNDTDHYGLRYAEFVVPLVKAVQEQQEQIEKQNEIINKQQEAIDMLMKEIENLKNN